MGEVNEHPNLLLDLLEPLREDPSHVVRKSVAGALSDLVKDNPETTYATLRRWRRDGSRPTRQIIRQALRHAVEKGDPRARELIESE